MIDTYYKAALAARLLDDKKGSDIVVLDLKDLCNFTDVFVVCTGNNRIHLNALADNVRDGMKKLGVHKPLEDGHRQANWAVLDYGDFVVHLMHHEARDFYRLESLWGDAVALDWEKLLTEHPIAAGSEY